MKERLDKLLKLLADDDTNAKKLGKCFHSDKEWDEATGGVWVAGIPIIPGFMMKLAEHNYDHFEPQAKTAYVVGHGYAIEKAREAGTYGALHCFSNECTEYEVESILNFI